MNWFCCFVFKETFVKGFPIGKRERLNILDTFMLQTMLLCSLRKCDPDLIHNIFYVRHFLNILTLHPYFTGWFWLASPHQRMLWTPAIFTCLFLRHIGFIQCWLQLSYLISHQFMIRNNFYIVISSSSPNV